MAKDPDPSLPEDSAATALIRALGAGLAREARTWARWAGAGAVAGAVLLGTTGAFVLGFSGFVWGALSGAVVGGLGALLFYLVASSETFL